jgi:hypothetical protein
MKLSKILDIIITIGDIFMYRGKNVWIDDTGFIHVINPPAIVAMDVRRIIGLIIGFSSFSIIWGAEFIFDHIVTMENRME